MEKAKQREATKNPTFKDLWVIVALALGSGSFWVIASLVRNISLGMLDDPVVGCTSLGCAPGLVNFAALILYGVAILLTGIAYLGLLAFIPRMLSITMIGVGGIGLVASLAGLLMGFDHSMAGTGLVISPLLLFSGVLSYVSKNS